MIDYLKEIFNSGLSFSMKELSLLINNNFGRYSDSEIREAIGFLREEEYPIVSIGRKYKKAKNSKEIREQIERYESRIKNYAKKIKNMKNASLMLDHNGGMWN